MDAEQGLVAAGEKIGALEVALAEHVEAGNARTRELDLTLGKLRRESREAGNARTTAQAALAAAIAERDDLRSRIAEAETQSVRARADGDRLRAHTAALGDELAAVRATVAVLQTAARLPAHRRRGPVAPVGAAASPPPARRPEELLPKSPEDLPVRAGSPKKSSSDRRRRCLCASPVVTRRLRRPCAGDRDARPRPRPARRSLRPRPRRSRSLSPPRNIASLPRSYRPSRPVTSPGPHLSQSRWANCIST